MGILLFTFSWHWVSEWRRRPRVGTELPRQLKMHKRRVKQMQPLITQSIKIQLIAAVHCSALQCNTAKPLHPQHGFKPTCAKRKMGLCIYMYIVLKIISQHIIQQIIIGKIFMNRKSESAWFDKGLSGNNTCMYGGNMVVGYCHFPWWQAHCSFKGHKPL